LSYSNALYIWDLKSLSDTHLQIFLPFCRFPFILFITSFTVWEIFGMIHSNLSILFYLIVLLVSYCQNRGYVAFLLFFPVVLCLQSNYFYIIRYPFPTVYSWHRVKYQLIIYARVYFWALFIVLWLLHLSLFQDDAVPIN
jgi:hypothetical protein